MILPTSHRIAYLTTIAVFLFGFILFFIQTSELIGSLFAALCASLLVLGSFIVVDWIIKSIKRS